MKNPLSLPKELYDWAVLEPQDRWERSKQTDELLAKQVENGRDIYAPIFDVGISSVEPLGEREFGLKRNPAGKVHIDLYHLNDGMSRLAQTWIPYDKQALYTATSGMAYTTMIPGYDQDRAERMAILGIPNIQVSAEQGDKLWPDLGDIKRLGRTALHAPEISIAKSSQAETEIIADLVARYGLPRLIEAHGDSRGSMTSFGRAIYAGLKQADGTPLYDLTPIWIDPKAVVLA